MKAYLAVSNNFTCVIAHYSSMEASKLFENKFGVICTIEKIPDVSVSISVKEPCILI